MSINERRVNFSRLGPGDAFGTILISRKPALVLWSEWDGEITDEQLDETVSNALGRRVHVKINTEAGGSIRYNGEIVELESSETINLVESRKEDAKKQGRDEAEAQLREQAKKWQRAERWLNKAEVFIEAANMIHNGKL